MVGRQEGHPACKILDVGGNDRTGALRLLQLQLSPPSPSHSTPNKIQSGDILVPANQGPPGK